MSGRSRRKKSPQWEREKWVRHWERASSGGRAEQEGPCHCIWQRSGVTPEVRKVRRMREHARLGARRRGTSQNQAARSKSGFWRHALCCETVDGGGGNEPDPLVTQSGGSHARSHCEQQGQGREDARERTGAERDVEAEQQGEKVKGDGQHCSPGEALAGVGEGAGRGRTSVCRASSWKVSRRTIEMSS